MSYTPPPHREFPSPLALPTDLYSTNLLQGVCFLTKQLIIYLGITSGRFYAILIDTPTFVSVRPFQKTCVFMLLTVTVVQNISNTMDKLFVLCVCVWFSVYIDCNLVFKSEY